MNIPTGVCPACPDKCLLAETVQLPWVISSSAKKWPQGARWILTPGEKGRMTL